MHAVCGHGSPYAHRRAIGLPASKLHAAAAPGAQAWSGTEAADEARTVRHHLAQVDAEEAGVARALPEQVERLHSQRFRQCTRAQGSNKQISYSQVSHKQVSCKQVSYKQVSYKAAVRRKRVACAGTQRRRALTTRLLPSVGTPGMSQVSSSRRAPGSGVKSSVSPRSITCARARTLEPGVALSAALHSAALHSVSWPGRMRREAVKKTSPAVL